MSWKNEPIRHALASKGIKTKINGKPIEVDKTDIIPVEKDGLISYGIADVDLEDVDKELMGALYVPSTCDLNVPIDDKEFQSRIDEARQKFSEKFGGTTTLMGVGTYLPANDDDDLVVEDVAIVKFGMEEEEFEKNKEEIKKWIWNKKDEWGQESITFEYQNMLKFI